MVGAPPLGPPSSIAATSAPSSRDSTAGMQLSSATACLHDGQVLVRLVFASLGRRQRAQHVGGIPERVLVVITGRCVPGAERGDRPAEAFHRVTGPSGALSGVARTNRSCLLTPLSACSCSAARGARVRLTLRSIVTLVEDTSAGSALPVLALVSVGMCGRCCRSRRHPAIAGSLIAGRLDRLACSARRRAARHG